jgi:hypothetical protein
MSSRIVDVTSELRWDKPGKAIHEQISREPGRLEANMSAAGREITCLVRNLKFYNYHRNWNQTNALYLGANLLIYCTFYWFQWRFYFPLQYTGCKLQSFNFCTAHPVVLQNWKTIINLFVSEKKNCILFSCSFYVNILLFNLLLTY